MLEKANLAKTKAKYSNITIAFPVDTHEIQFRNESDRMNITNKIQGATALIISGASTTSMAFTTANDVIVNMTAAEMLTCGTQMLAIKDQVFYTFKVVKDAIRATTTMAEIEAIDLALLD